MVGIDGPRSCGRPLGRPPVRQSSIRPTGVDRTFGEDEIIVSKTDAKGIITYANDVFLRISGYPECDVIGQPHNLIRHPDMPRAVFGLLWDKISNGAEIFAYVVNLAADGAHYWVLAHVTPTRSADGRITGYHSNRRTADRGALAVVEPLYRDLLAEERRHANPKDAMRASTLILTQLLTDRGMSYDEFVWSLEPANAVRDQAAGGTARRAA